MKKLRIKALVYFFIYIFLPDIRVAAAIIPHPARFFKRNKKPRRSGAQRPYLIVNFFVSVPVKLPMPVTVTVAVPFLILFSYFTV